MSNERTNPTPLGVNTAFQTGATGTITIDASTGNVFPITATANLTLNVVNVRPGKSIDIVWLQSGGVFTLTWGSGAGIQTVTGVGNAQPVPVATSGHTTKITLTGNTTDMSGVIGASAGT